MITFGQSLKFPREPPKGKALLNTMQSISEISLPWLVVPVKTLNFSGGVHVSIDDSPGTNVEVEPGISK
jgi:hypothetical protein